MTTTVSWILPLVLLPGVALLIMSTSVRYGQIHSELHHILESQEAVSTMFHDHLLRRATFFRNALVALYVSVAVFAIGSISGAIAELLQGPGNWLVIIFTCIGILCLIGAAVELIRESILSLQVIDHHLMMIDSDNKQKENKNDVI